MTDQIDFALPLTTDAPSKMPSGPIVRSAEIEDGYRWTLRRAWGSGPCVLWCGLNPSTADGEVDDPTMLREIGFSYRWGFGSLVKVNVYPLISPDPKALKAWRKTWNVECADPDWDRNKCSFNAQTRNMEKIAAAMAEADTCVAAWGNGILDPSDLAEFLWYVRPAGAPGDIKTLVDWKCLGVNENGSPKHSLARGAYRVPDDAKLIPWSTS